MRKDLLIIILILLLPGTMLAKKREHYRVHSVEFSGNKTFGKSALHKVILSRPSHFLIPVRYEEDIFVSDLDALKNFYQRRGFLKTDITEYTVVRDSLKMRVDIKISLEEGPRTVIDAITYLGNVSLPDSVLAKITKMKTNDPFDADVIEKSQLAILRYYADRGYIEAEIKPVWSLDNTALHAILDFNITEGQEYVVGHVFIKGLEKTQEYVILRELTLQPGDILNYSRILKSQRNLYLTGLFETVFIDPEVNDSDPDSAQQDLYVKVKENQAGAFNVSFGYGSVDRVRVRSEFLQNNLRGTSKKIGLSGQVSSIERLIQLSFTNPRIYSSLWRMDANLKYELQYQPVYDLKTYGSALAVQKQLDRYLSVTFSYRDEINELSNVKLDTLVGVSAADVHGIKLRIARDTRDNLFIPTKGTLVEWENEVAGGPVTSSNSFYRSVFKYRWFKPVFKKSVLGTAIETGFLTSLGGNQRISVQERFYSGGPSSLRGYAYREVGPHDINGYSKGGFYKLIWNVFELRVPVYKDLRVAFFSDVGNVWWDYQDIFKGEWAVDYGVGLNYNTPLGIVRIDFGVPAGSIPVKDKVRFNFSMGYAF